MGTLGYSDGRRSSVALDEMSGTSRIDLVGKSMGGGCHRGAHLFVGRGELCLYPIGVKVRVTVERVT